MSQAPARCRWQGEPQFRISPAAIRFDGLLLESLSACYADDEISPYHN
jgi:hypothetical protein